MLSDYQDLQSELIRMRRALHLIPETGCELPETAAFIRSELHRLGLPYTLSTRDSGILAVLDTGRPGKTVLFRADMDALPVEEQTGLPFASRHPGNMHACGHDAHVAMLLGAAMLLQRERDALRGRILFLFQTNEEQILGAKNAIDEGWLVGVDAVFGMHIGSIMGKDVPSGTIHAVPGCCMASVDRFRICLQGVGCHGSTPEMGVDPVNIAAHVILSLQALQTRELGAKNSVVLTIGSIHGGTEANIIPDEVFIEGTLRCLDPQVRRKALLRMEALTQATAAGFCGNAEIVFYTGAPAVINDPELAALAADCARSVVGDGRVRTRIDAPTMISEDFSYYLENTKGAFLFLCASDAAKQTDYPHHSPRFNIDESVLWEGSVCFARIAERMLA